MIFEKVTSSYAINLFMNKTFIRSIKFNDKDKEDWEKLYHGYAEFYKVEMTQTILNTVWSWLIDEKHEVHGLVCEADVGCIYYVYIQV